MKLLHICIIITILYICAIAMCGCVTPRECKRMMTEAYWQGRADTQIECNRAISNQKIFFENQDKYIDWMREKDLSHNQK